MLYEIYPNKKLDSGLMLNRNNKTKDDALDDSNIILLYYLQPNYQLYIH